MRSLSDIKQEIIDKYVIEMAAIGTAINPTTWSATNLQNLIIYVVAFCIYIHENLFETFKTEVAETIANKNPHTLKWYANKVLAFQYGYNLVADADYYDNTGLTQAQIDASKVVTYCAVTDKADILTIKVAKNSGTALEPLSNPQLSALQGYMQKIKDAGVFLTFVNESADSLKLNLAIHYNPMLMNASGVNILTSEETVKIAIKNYLTNLPFNGEFAPQNLVDVLQKVEGVVYVRLNSVLVRSDNAAPYQSVDVFYLPASGYLRLLDEPNDLVISYVPYNS